MAKARSRVIDYLAYVGIRLLGCVMQIIPPELATRIAESLAGLVYHVDRRHRDVALDNLRRAFPNQYSDAQRHDIVRRVYRHFAVVILEMFLSTRKITAGTVRRIVDGTEFSRIVAAVRTGRPVIILTAHYGNWELAAHYLGLQGVHSHLVARTLDNPYLDEMVRETREWTGHTVLAKNGDVRRMRRILEAGGNICTLGDQNAGPHGIFVNFFGSPASTHKAIAHLSRKTGALIAVAGVEKTGGLLEYAIRVMDIVDPEEYAGHADADFAITQRCTAGIEAMIRRSPHQYLWLHRRWKHQPPSAEVREAA